MTADPKRIETSGEEVLREFAQLGLWGRALRKLKQGDLVDAVLRKGVREIRRLQGRFRSADIHYRLDPERVLTKRYAETFPLPGPHHKLVGNYVLDSRIALSAKSVVYSLGVGGDVLFDRAMATTYGCDVFMYDPTPSSIDFIALLKIKEAGNPIVGKFKFHPVGAWREDTTLRFEIPLTGGMASAVEDVGRTSAFFDARCESIKTMMRNNGHDHIDVLKMDIEGAAEAVLESLLDDQIYPTQLVAEFERPTGDVRKVLGFFSNMDALCARMRTAGYEITYLPRDRANYFGLELLFSRA